MNIDKFYRRFIEDKKMARIQGDYIKDEEQMAELAALLNGKEQDLIDRLKRIHPMDGYFEVEYAPDEHPILTGTHIIINHEGKGLIHTRAVTVLSRMLKRGGRPTDTARLMKEAEDWIDAAAVMDHKMVLDGYPEAFLEVMVRNLGHDSEAASKKGYIRELNEILTDPEVLQQMLSQIPPKEYYALMSYVNRTEYSVKLNDFRILHFTGVILPVSEDVGMLHKEVMEAVKRAAQDRAVPRSPVDSSNGYDAMRLKVTLLHTKTPIWREIIVPMNLNFYELHLIIQAAMGWDDSHMAEFLDDHHEIFVHSFDMEGRMEFGTAGSRKEYLAREVQVGAVLGEGDSIRYWYDYGDDWLHEVKVLEAMTLGEPVLPSVEKYRGPVVMDDVGGVGGLEEMLAILKDESHPEYEETLLWARSNGYRQRYPKQAINRKLAALFSGEGPLGASDAGALGLEESIEGLISEHEYALALFGEGAAPSDYIDAMVGYAEDPHRLHGVVAEMDEEEVLTVVDWLLGQEGDAVQYILAKKDGMKTLHARRLVVPAGAGPLDRWAIHPSISEPLLALLFDKESPKHPGRLHSEKYMKDVDMKRLVDESMTIEEIKDRLRSMKYRGYSKLKKWGLVETYTGILTSREWLAHLLERIHPVELVVLNNKTETDALPFWSSLEPCHDLQRLGLVFEAAYDGCFMHPETVRAVRKVDIESIIEAHIEAGRLNLQ